MPPGRRRNHTQIAFSQGMTTDQFLASRRKHVSGTDQAVEDGKLTWHRLTG
jgi:hypothetical protein